MKCYATDEEPAAQIPELKNNKTTIMKYKTRSKSKATLVLLTLFILLTLISCNQVKKEPVQAQQSPVPPSNQEQPVTANTVQSVQNKTEGQSLTVQNNTEVMLNPPHGQPYHRCDIPVGAPLNSTPAGTNIKATNNQIQTTTPKSSTSAPNVANNPYSPTVENASRLNPSQPRNTTTVTSGNKPRLNPPHGQPFHRCEIPVGSPLPNTP